MSTMFRELVHQPKIKMSELTSTHKKLDCQLLCREQEIVVHQPKIKMSELMSACLDVVERGGKEVVRVRGLADIGIAH